MTVGFGSLLVFEVVQSDSIRVAESSSEESWERKRFDLIGLEIGIDLVSEVPTGLLFPDAIGILGDFRVPECSASGFEVLNVRWPKQL